MKNYFNPFIKDRKKAIDIGSETQAEADTETATGTEKENETEKHPGKEQNKAGMSKKESEPDPFLNDGRLESIRRHRRIVKSIVLALKIGFGSALAIGLASAFGLSQPASAGTIALLTLVNTKRGTISLIVKRFITFIITVCMCLILFTIIDHRYTAFSLFLFFIVFITEILGWGSTLSVNALIGIHFLTQPVLDTAFIVNEFFLLCIGVGIAFILNLFYAYNNMKLHMYACRKKSEQELYNSLNEICHYLRHESKEDLSIRFKETELEDESYLAAAKEYAGNFYSRAPECYVEYFEMRMRQMVLLNSVLTDMEYIRKNSWQAELVCAYLEFISRYIGEIDPPRSQIEELNRLMAKMLENKTLKSVDFEDLAILYHVLLTFRDLMDLKTEFIETMDEKQKRILFKNWYYKEQKAVQKHNASPIETSLDHFLSD